MHLLRPLLDSRLWPLILKEVRQILKNKQIIFLLLFPPTVQLLVFGLALNPDVTGLSLGVVDYSNSPDSRDFVASLVANDVFEIDSYQTREADLGQQVRIGQISTGLIIPPDFGQKLAAGKPVDVQVLIDGVDANTAGIANGYISQLINRYGQTLGQTEERAASSDSGQFSLQSRSAQQLVFCSRCDRRRSYANWLIGLIIHSHS